MGQQRASNGAPGASRAEIARSVPPRFCAGAVFPLTLRFGLDGSPLRSVPARPKPLTGETKKSARAPANRRALRPAPPVEGHASPPPVFLAAWRESAAPVWLVFGVRKTGRGVSGFCRVWRADDSALATLALFSRGALAFWFRSRGHAAESLRRRILRPLAPPVILGFSRRPKTGGFYGERRTSCELFNRAFCRIPGETTRLPGASPPWTPTRGGAGPPSGLPPPNAARQVSHGPYAA
jgi:hypothetical protein